MNEFVKTYVVRQRLKKLKELWGSKESEPLYTDLAEEIEYSSKEELWMILNTLKAVDTTKKKELAKEILERVSNTEGEAVKRHYGILQTFIEGIHGETCENGCLCANTLSKILLCLSEDTDIFFREIKRHIYSQSDLSFSTVNLTIISMSDVYRKLSVSLFHQYSSVNTFKSIETLGALFGALNEDEILYLINGMYKKEEPFFLLRCTAYSAIAAANKGIDRSRHIVKNLLAKGAMNTLRKCYKYKSFSQIVYTLAAGMFYLLGYLGASFSAFSPEILSFHLSAPCSGHIAQALQVLVLIGGGAQKNAAILSLCTELFCRSKVHHTASLSLIKTALSYSLKRACPIDSTHIDQILSILAQQKLRGKDVAEVLVEISRGYKKEKECSNIALRKSIYSSERRKDHLLFFLIDPMYFSIWEYSLAHTEAIKYAESATAYEMHKHFLPHLMRYKKSTVREVSQVIALRAEKEVEFMPVLLEVLKGVSIPYLAPTTLQSIKKHYAYIYKVLSTLKRQDLAQEYIKESLWKISTKKLFAEGCAFFFYGCVSFPFLTTRYICDILTYIKNKVSSRSPVQYSYAAKIIEHFVSKEDLIEEKEKKAFLYRVALLLCTNKAIFWLYENRSLSFSIPSILSLVLVCARKELDIQCKEALQYIKRDSTVQEIIVCCSTALGLIEASDGELYHSRVSHAEASYLLGVLHRHRYAPAVLSAFSHSLLFAAELDMHTKEVCASTILAHAKENVEGISALSNALNILPSIYKEVVARIKSMSLPLTQETLLLLGKLVWRVETYADIAQSIEKIDSLYNASSRVEQKVESMYICFKILQCRVFRECGESVLYFLLNKLETDGLPPFLFSQVAELFSTTHIDLDLSIKEIQHRVDRKKATHLSSLLLTLKSSSTSVDILEYCVQAKEEAIPVTEAISVFLGERSFKVQAEKYSLIKEQCIYIGENTYKSSFLKNTMAFFVKESLSPIICVFKDACESLPGLLVDLFPLALYEGIKDLPSSLRRRVVDALGGATKKKDLSQKEAHVFSSALEYLLKRYLRQPEAEHILPYLDYKRTYRCREARLPQEEIQKMLCSLQTDFLDSAMSLVCSIKGSLHVQDKSVHEAADTLYREILLSGETVPAECASSSLYTRDRLRLVQCIRDLGASADSVFNLEPSSALEDTLKSAECSLLHWSAPILPFLRDIAFSSTHEELLLDIRKIREKAASMQHKIGSEYSRMYYLFKQHQKKEMDMSSFYLSLKNELCSSFLKHTGIMRLCRPKKQFLSLDSPFASLFSLALYNKDLVLIRGILCLEADKKEIFGKKALEHYSCISTSKKELDEIYGALFRVPADKEIFSPYVHALSRSKIREWEKGSLALSAPPKKRIDILRKAMQVSFCKYDPLLLLSILCGESSCIREREMQESIYQIVEEASADGWIDYLHEVFLLSTRLFSYSPYLSLVEKLFFAYPEKVSSIWVHFSAKKDRSWPERLPVVFQNMEKNPFFIRHREAVSVINEIVETPNEKVFQLIKRFREAKKRARETYRTESAWSPSMSSVDLSLSPIQKDILRLDASISALYTLFMFREEYSGENTIYNYISLFKKAVRARDGSRAWEVLTLHRINKLIDALSQAMPSQIVLNDKGKRALRNIFLPGSFKQVYSCVSTISVVSSLQRPRKISLIGEDGVVYTYLAKKEKEGGIERPAAYIFSVLEANHSTTHEILFSGVSISTYIQNSLSLKEIVCEVRESRERLAGKKGRSILHKEKNALSLLCHDYNELREIEKLELYQRVTNFNGPEIREWLVIHSFTLQSFFIRTDTFARTYLYSSIAAYLLGLGDRHPGNILILFKDASSFHIDYTDVLDTLQRRKILQERVPFRLTPMITTAIGASIEEQLLSACKLAFSKYRRSFYLIESFFVLFFSNRQHYKRLSLPEALSLIEKKVPKEDREEEEGRRLFREASSDEYLSQMYLGWMSFW